MSLVAATSQFTRLTHTLRSMHTRPARLYKARLKVAFTSALVSFAVSCAPNDPLPRVAQAEAEEVTLAQLLSSPRKYDGVVVRVIARASIAFEGNAIFQQPDRNKSDFYKNSIWLDLGWPVSANVRELNGKYVLVEGRFDLAATGHGGMYQGSMRDIRRIEESSKEAVERRFSRAQCPDACYLPPERCDRRW